MKQKTILFLGAATFQTPPIQYALGAGYRVITCDNRPENAGHKLAHRAYSVSTLDHSSVLKIATEEAIDGVLSFGSDVSAYTAAYVAREMKLPGNRPESILTLCRKHDFREAIDRAGIQSFEGAAFCDSEVERAISFAMSLLPGQFVVKPADASGSKGVCIGSVEHEIPRMIETALSMSIRGLVVIERLVPKHGYQLCGDGYFQDGAIAFIQYGNGHFYDDGHRMAPYGESFPSAHPASLLDLTTAKLEAVLRACGFGYGPFNFDVLIDARTGDPFVVEIGPRSGGNYLPTVIRYHSGVDLIEAAVESCLRPNYRFASERKIAGHFHSSFMVHATRAGTYHGLDMSPSLGAKILEQHPYISEGQPYRPFVNASDTLGNMILAFDDYETMLQTMDQPDSIATLR